MDWLEPLKFDCRLVRTIFIFMNLLMLERTIFIFVVPHEFIDRAVPNSTIGGQINTTFLVEFLLNCGIRGRW